MFHIHALKEYLNLYNKTNKCTSLCYVLSHVKYQHVYKATLMRIDMTSCAVMPPRLKNSQHCSVSRQKLCTSTHQGGQESCYIQTIMTRWMVKNWPCFTFLKCIDAVMSMKSVKCRNFMATLMPHPMKLPSPLWHVCARNMAPLTRITHLCPLYWTSYIPCV